MIRMILFFILLFFQNVSLKADVAHGVIDKYKNRVLVITKAGWYGNFALSVQAGFSEIHIMDDDAVLIEHSKIILAKWLKDNKRHVATSYYFGNSQIDLEIVINRIHGPITFFLNSDRPNPDQMIEQKLLEELGQIKNHPIKRHTILMDYANHTAIPIDAIKQKLLEINPNYTFKFEMGGHLGKEEKAILVAHLV